MRSVHKQRLFLIFSCLIVLSAASFLALYALQENINLFYMPSEIPDKIIRLHCNFRLGGQVKPGSIAQDPHSLKTQFKVRDQKKEIRVIYTGVLPDLFRAGQSVVVEGRFNQYGILVAQRVLAKHDERYRPRVSA